MIGVILIILLAGCLLGMGFHIFKAFLYLFSANKLAFFIAVVFLGTVLITPTDLFLRILIAFCVCMIVTAVHKAKIQKEQRT